GILNSRVEPYVGDFMTMDLTDLGRFDVVLFLGVLYHLEEPLRAMRRLAGLTAPGGLAVIETQAVEYPGQEGVTFCEFYPGQELTHAPSTGWPPTARALVGLRRAGGSRGPPLPPQPPSPPPPPRPPLRKRLAAAVKHVVWGQQSPEGPRAQQDQLPSP